jgi:AmmeMemoRadiSam system protein A
MSQGNMLSAEERHLLLQIARQTIEAQLTDRRPPKVDSGSARLFEAAGAFVTLHAGQQLRGCIGTFEAMDPLVTTVQRMAIAAATSDPRFPSVKAHELSKLRLEISVLSPLQPSLPEKIEVGVHGIYITQKHHRGVLLPQVATEYHWDRETFLQHTCLKAGLPPEAYKDPSTVIETFTAEVFGEEQAD